MVKIFLLVMCLFSHVVCANQNVKFSVQNLEKTKFYNQKSFKGSVAFVTQFLVDCPNCLKEIAVYSKLSTQMPEVKFAMISLSSVEETAQATDVIGTKGLLFLQPNSGVDVIKFSKRLGNVTMETPYTLVLKPNGDFCESHVGVISDVEIKEISLRCKV